MPLWDNFARQAEALPMASPHGADDFVAIHDASLGAAARTAMRNLRSRELFTVNLYTSTGASPPTTTTTRPLRVFRAPYAFTITSVVLACQTAPAGTFAGDVWADGLSIFDGGNTLNASKLALSSGQTRTERTDFIGQSFAQVAADAQFWFHVAATQSSIRLPQITLMGYRS